MRVILWGINYAPEPKGIAPYTTELAGYFQGSAMDVEVVTRFVRYSAWRESAADRRKLCRDGNTGAINVHRYRQYAPKKPNMFRRVLHEVSFGLASLCRTLFLPGKKLSVFSAGPPVITTADETSNLARAVRVGGFGGNVPAAYPGPFAHALREAARNPQLLGEWRSRTCWVDRFSPDAMPPKFEAAVRRVALAGGQCSEPDLETFSERMKSR